MTPDEKVRRFATTHHGLVDRTTARAAGLTDRQIRSRVASGRWQKLSPRVFALGAATPTPERALLAAVWATGGLASHPSAGWLLGLLDRQPAVPHVSVGQNGGHHHRGLVVHRSRDLRPSDLTTVRGIPTTTADRTIIDLASMLDPQELRGCVDRAMRLGLTRPDRLISRHLALSRPGRPGSAATRALLTELDHDLALVESDLESLLLRIIRAGGLPLPTPQHQVQIGDRRYRIDLCYPEAMLAIEGDGFRAHGGRSAFEEDRVRQNDLVLAGWRVLRFTWRQICAQPDWVVRQIREALAVGGTSAVRN